MVGFFLYYSVDDCRLFCLAMAGFCVSQIDNSALSEDREHKKLKIDKHKTPPALEQGIVSPFQSDRYTQGQVQRLHRV